MSVLRKALASAAVAALLGCGAVPALAQIEAPPNPAGNVAGLTALENANFDGGNRSPGRMTDYGLLRAQTAIRPSVSFSVTETQRPLNPRQIFLIDAIEIIFGDLNTAILLIENAIRVRHGATPRLPDISGIPDVTDLGGLGSDGNGTGEPDASGDGGENLDAAVIDPGGTGSASRKDKL